MSFSFVLPRIKAIHISMFRIIAVSKFGAFKCLAHYTPRGRFLSKTVRNFFGEPNHYGRDGTVLGYSRQMNHWTVVHFGRTGKPLGYSRRFLWVVWIHHGPVFETFLQPTRVGDGKSIATGEFAIQHTRKKSTNKQRKKSVNRRNVYEKKRLYRADICHAVSTGKMSFKGGSIWCSCFICYHAGNYWGCRVVSDYRQE